MTAIQQPHKPQHPFAAASNKWAFAQAFSTISPMHPTSNSAHPGLHRRKRRSHPRTDRAC